jgi:hypothetical protein
MGRRGEMYAGGTLRGMLEMEGQKIDSSANGANTIRNFELLSHRNALTSPRPLNTKHPTSNIPQASKTRTAISL